MPDGRPSVDQSLESTTRSLPSIDQQLENVGIPGLTLLCHPDFSRVGEQAALPNLLAGQVAELTRAEPYFSQPGGGESRPLSDPHLSRRPIIFASLGDGGLRLDASAVKSGVSVDGEELTQFRDFDRAALEAGVVVVLNRLVAVLVHWLPSPQKRPPSYGLVGESAAILETRREIERLACLEYPVLLRGESGTGKELVGRALHEAGPRKSLPCIGVNMGAVPPNLAAAELFGSVKGAFTGADQRRVGYFQQADGGTLFLDEVGDTPADVQVLLLRALETGFIQPLGAERPVAVDVRLVSATDIDLEAAMELGELRSSLFHRLSSCEIELPSLRERRGDIARLFFHFLTKELDSVAAAMQAAGPEPPSFPNVPAEWVAKLLAYRWPGNVRELRNVVRRLVVSSWGQSELRVPASLERRLLEVESAALAQTREDSVESASSTETQGYRRLEEITEAELLDALRRNRWNVRRTAKALGVARPSLYRLMRTNSKVRKASDLSAKEIAGALEQYDGDLEKLVDRFEVSKRGLKLRISEFGLS